jgi:DNA-binding CsgD family transcriptional regulator
MNLWIFIYNVALFGALFGLSYVSYRQSRRLGVPFFLSYAYYLIAAGLAGFVCNFGRSMVALSSRERLLDSATTEFSYQILIVLAVPIMVVSWHFFVRTIVRLAGAPFAGFHRTVYVVCQTGTLVALAVLFASLVSVPTATTNFFFRTAYILVNGLGIVINVDILAWAVLRAKSWTDAEKRRSVGMYGFLSILLLFLYYGSSFLSPRWPVWIVSYLTMHFARHLVPFLYILSSSRRWAPDPAAANLEADFSALASRLPRLSHREMEVAALMLKGRDNAQIHRELFISAGTVKNHVSNIYKKLGIKSRLQLMNLVREARGEVSPR